MSTPARKAALVVAGTGIYASAALLTYQFLRAPKEDELLPPPPNPDTANGLSSSSSSSSSSSCFPAAGCCSSSSSSASWLDSPFRAGRFDAIASSYDSRIDWDERLLGMPLLRRWLLRRARGDVLEVGAGTARNLPYYQSDAVRRLVLADRSDEMLQCARDKLRDAPPPRPTVTLVADAARLPLPDGAFDTVVDTFGLCSYDDPVAALQEMARVCKPDGTILLLEHGRSHRWEFVSNHLDRTAEHHARTWGCVWNRDLDSILERSGLHVQSLSQWHLGTTYCAVCAPSKSESHPPPPPTTSE